MDLCILYAKGTQRQYQMLRWYYYPGEGGSLEGFCSWVLGEEYPAIWDVLPAHS